MRSDLERISDILEAILQIRRYADKCDRSSFTGDELVQVWVIHHLQVIGEAAAGLSARTKSDPAGYLHRFFGGIDGMQDIDFLTTFHSRLRFS